MLDSALGGNPAARHLQSIAARALAGIGMTPDAATIAGVITGVIAGVAFGAGATALGIAMLALSAAMDAVDGTIARERSTPTAHGGLLDLCSDRVVEVAVIVGIAWRRPEIHFAAFVLVASWYVNITVFLAVGAALEHKGPKLIEYPPGILERTEALIFFVILALARPIGPILCWAFTALEIATGAQRFIFGWRTIGRS
ncbi:MAG TPA: CDP-alcohol phosphatidyltransferase family protein [Candidatus Binataceae bacterium]|nr:CDP-alcohol phosphatidyltransferase family protein [Candidatus Binataceae bacterium]